jgi:hypothetical protein
MPHGGYVLLVCACMRAGCCIQGWPAMLFWQLQVQLNASCVEHYLLEMAAPNE